MDWQNVRSIGGNKITTPPKQYDKYVSEIAGKDISTTDPRLMRFCASKKQELGEDVSLQDALKNSPVMREELKNALH